MSVILVILILLFTMCRVCVTSSWSYIKSFPPVLIYIKKNIPIRSFLYVDLVDDLDLLLIEVNIKGI